MTMTACHDGTVFTIPNESIDTSGGASAMAANLLATGTAVPMHTSWPVNIYPLFGDPAPWPDQHHHHHYPYPWYPTVIETHTHVTAPSAEKPHEVVQRALKEIAQAARALRDSAEAMGVPVDEGALEEAIVAKLREAL